MILYSFLFILFKIFWFYMKVKVSDHAWLFWENWMTFINCDFRGVFYQSHYDDVILSLMASQIISLAIVYSTSYSGVDQRNHQSSASLAFVRGIHRGPVNSPHKRPVTQKMFPFDDVIMYMKSSMFLWIRLFRIFWWNMKCAFHLIS